ncbi:MAG: EVE domain-containing protein [Dokdonella sp.]|nr:EVE domain-containing protein [Dokdonella sp.]
MKSEPDVFSIDDLAKVDIEPWSGVRNYQARNFMRDDMREGDGVLFYHSSCAQPGVVGIARVASAAYPDPTQFDRRSEYFDAKARRETPRWMLVDLRFERKLAGPIGLTELRAQPRLSDFALLQRGNRLSILPVTRQQWDVILGMESPRRGH